MNTGSRACLHQIIDDFDECWKHPFEHFKPYADAQAAQKYAEQSFGLVPQFAKLEVDVSFALPARLWRYYRHCPKASPERLDLCRRGCLPRLDPRRLQSCPNTPFVAALLEANKSNLE